jgi:hypothetical protein
MEVKKGVGRGKKKKKKKKKASPRGKVRSDLSWTLIQKGE